MAVTTSRGGARDLWPNWLVVNVTPTPVVEVGMLVAAQMVRCIFAVDDLLHSPLSTVFGNFAGLEHESWL